MLVSLCARMEDKHNFSFFENKKEEEGRGVGADGRGKACVCLCVQVILDHSTLFEN